MSFPVLPMHLYTQHFQSQSSLCAKPTLIPGSLLFPEGLKYFQSAVHHLIIKCEHLLVQCESCFPNEIMADLSEGNISYIP